MNLADPELELIDPTPNVHALFVQFDARFFWGRLASRVVVRWSKRMYSCAGICRYEGRGGLCDVALSEPLLKLRPRKDLIETLLHEMIHAYLFIVGGDRDREGHGPIFLSHMYRINKMADLNITVYHDFHDEVRLYLTHWWRCNGPCKYRSPHFGIVRRSANRAPCPRDSWWNQHLRTCGGTFVKIKQPPEKRRGKKGKQSVSLGDLSNFFKNSSNVKAFNNDSQMKDTLIKNDSAIKTINNVKTFGDLHNKTKIPFIKTNGGGGVVSPKNINYYFNSVQASSSKGLGKDTVKTNNENDGNVSQFVRNIWANKQLPPNKIETNNFSNKRNNTDLHDITMPPFKIKKIEDPSNSILHYKKPFNDDVATSVLKDIYGKDFTLYHKKNHDGNKIAVTHSGDPEIVSCPLCNIRVKYSAINSHVDECLNNAEIEKLRVEGDESLETSKSEVNVSEIIDLTCAKIVGKNCPCCDKIVSDSMEEHLENCFSFSNDNDTTPKNVITNIDKKSEQDFINSFFEDNDSFVDELDESGIFNDTGTKFPCPCCLQTIEETDMNQHLDMCLVK